MLDTNRYRQKGFHRCRVFEDCRLRVDQSFEHLEVQPLHLRGCTKKNTTEGLFFRHSELFKISYKFVFSCLKAWLIGNFKIAQLVCLKSVAKMSGIHSARTLCNDFISGFKRLYFSDMTRFERSSNRKSVGKLLQKSHSFSWKILENPTHRCKHTVDWASIAFLIIKIEDAIDIL